MKYLIICKFVNGNVITASANSFSVATLIAEKFISGVFTKRVEKFISGEVTKRVEIVKILTGATIRYIY